MSVSTTSRGLYQPFQCLICQSRFTRHENLKRHALLHSRSQDEPQLPCDFCSATFSRPDLRNRHMKRKHPEQDQRRAKKRAHRESSVSVSPPESNDGLLQVEDNNLGYPGWNALQQPETPRSAERSQDISELMQEAMSEPRIDRIGQDVMDLQTLLEAGPSILKQNNVPSPDFTGINIYEDWSPSSRQITTGCDLFFAHVSHFVPFLHQPTFDPSQTPHLLLLSMLSLAYQYDDDPEGGSNTGAELSRQCFHRARTLLKAEHDTDTPEPFSSNIATVQSYLLLQICAMMYLCGPDSTYALKMHSAMISLSRSAGLMQPIPVEPSSTQDLKTLWHTFIKSESHKRTLFAIHQIDALWYQFLSIPRSVSHLEVKHDLPCPQEHWAASAPEEWAHRQLVKQQGPSLQYADAVRRFLSHDSASSLTSIPSFDPYGAINITQFLISSAREISGWSTMTGMLSIDRFGALRSSLLALNPFICPSDSPSPSPSPSQPIHSAIPIPHPKNALCTATYETALIELQIWSPSHTSGIVEASLDAVLSASTHPYLSPSPEILCEEITASAIQPHVDWFLRYLDVTVDVRGEAPWVAIYAYKAFLIAYTLVRGGVEGGMGVVGVGDGDGEGAVRWARGVFGRRRRWVLGRLIWNCLDGLESGV
ncbi:fungal specific transcription factor domain-containing protein [Aspergillus stella-maris]|uniref:fungal specific transcription factor domain-containing protein n=1 Tax=Aspergillus stella-maris TaxID=1810926 RepID=UPI003CCD698F